MRPRYHTTALALIFAATAVAPGAARAQVTELNSSVSAYCVQSDCSTVRFALRLASDHPFDIIGLWSDDPAMWSFGGLIAVEDQWGNDLGWTGALRGSVLALTPISMLGTDPVFFTVTMQNWSGWANLDDLRLTGRHESWPQGQKRVVEFDTRVTAATAVTATPEPASMMLMGLGLAGVFGAARRRRAAG